MHLSGRPVAAFDPEGLIFAAGINSECVKLYDLRSFDRVSYNIWLLTVKGGKSHIVPRAFLW